MTRLACKTAAETIATLFRTRKHKVTTDINHKFNIAPNLLDRDFSAETPDQKWAGDISYICKRIARSRWPCAGRVPVNAPRNTGSQASEGRAVII
jgi:transposase InsO family protein